MTPMNPKSAGTLIWTALIVNVLGLIVLAAEAQFVFSAFAAVLVLVPSIFARHKAGIGARFVLVISLALVYAGYPKFAGSPYMQRAKAAGESGVQAR